MKKVLILAFGLGLAACSNVSQTTMNDVSALELSLTTVEQTALIYTSLPRCDVNPMVKLCSDPMVVSKIKAYDNEAYAAVKFAANNSGALQAAITAVTNLKSVIPQ